jgi:hypothetical protein
MAKKRTAKEGALGLTPYDNICNSSILAGTGQPPTLQVGRGSNLHRDNDGWANCRPVSADLLYTTLDTLWVKLLVIGSGFVR